MPARHPFERIGMGGYASRCMPLTGVAARATASSGSADQRTRQNLSRGRTTAINQSAVRFETVNGKEELILTPLEKLEEPASLVQLREAVEARLPRLDLPEIVDGDCRPEPGLLKCLPTLPSVPLA